MNSKSPYPNELLNCIVLLMEYSLVQVGDKDTIPEDKVKFVRNWLKRKEIRPALIHMEIPVNKERQERYFDTAFLSLTGDIKSANILSMSFLFNDPF